MSWIKLHSEIQTGKWFLGCAHCIGMIIHFPRVPKKVLSLRQFFMFLGSFEDSHGWTTLRLRLSWMHEAIHTVRSAQNPSKITRWRKTVRLFRRRVSIQIRISFIKNADIGKVMVECDWNTSYIRSFRSIISQISRHFCHVKGSGKIKDKRCFMKLNVFLDPAKYQSLLY